jgi:hypothetical protein
LKALAILALCLSAAAGAASGQCGVVQEPRLSSANIRVEALPDGKAPLPAATIEIWKIDAHGKPVATQIRATAGRDGKSSLDLADGKYLAVFRNLGFQRKIVGFPRATSDSSQSSSVPLILMLTLPNAL